jgi:hypothetical protein
LFSFFLRWFRLHLRGSHCHLIGLRHILADGSDAFQVSEYIRTHGALRASVNAFAANDDTFQEFSFDVHYVVLTAKDSG